MRLIRKIRHGRDPNALYIATDVLPDVEFRIDMTVHDTKDKIIKELKRRIKEHKEMEKPTKTPLEREIEDAIKAKEEF